MRRIRVTYVENDPVLRSLLGGIIEDSSILELAGVYGSALEALQNQEDVKADVALIDFSLEKNGLNGVELGIALRSQSENLGIVIYSQFSVTSMVKRVPEKMRIGWSFIDKSAEMKLTDYERVLSAAAEGKGNWMQVIEDDLSNETQNTRLFLALSSRQRLIMSMKIRGLNAKEIAQELAISYTYVRKEISRAYAILVPEPTPESDIKTLALMRFLEITSVG